MKKKKRNQNQYRSIFNSANWHFDHIQLIADGNVRERTRKHYISLFIYMYLYIYWNSFGTFASTSYTHIKRQFVYLRLAVLFSFVRTSFSSSRIWLSVRKKNYSHLTSEFRCLKRNIPIKSFILC